MAKANLYNKIMSISANKMYTIKKAHNYANKRNKNQTLRQQETVNKSWETLEKTITEQMQSCSLICRVSPRKHCKDLNTTSLCPEPMFILLLLYCQKGFCKFSLKQVVLKEFDFTNEICVLLT